MDFTATFLGGGTLTQSFTTDGIRSTGSAFETVAFTGFNDVVSVSWLVVSPYIQFDNVTIASDEVSEPAAFIVFGLSVGGLALARRRKMAACDLYLSKSS